MTRLKLRALKHFAIFFLIWLTSACGGGQYYGETSDTTINAINLSNKNLFSALAENRNMQPVTFDVVENIAYMNGIMDSSIPLLVKNLIENHPSVDTIVMQKVMGTIDFNATLQAGRLVREACLKTVVSYEGVIASGGVHFFLGGCQRLIETGGRLGIHTWKYTLVNDSGETTESWVASDLSPTDPAHDKYLDYQIEMDIPEELYWTIIAVPFDRMRYLSENEIDVFNISTNPTKIWGAPYQLAISDAKSQISWEAARFYVSDNIATLQGKISNQTTINLHRMLADHPEVDTIHFGHVTGTTGPDLRYTIKLGYAIRNICLTTSISRRSFVAPEALHAFIAGCHRKQESGGKINASSWVGSSSSSQQKNLSYYEQMGISIAFYQFLSRDLKHRISSIEETFFTQFGIDVEKN